MVKVTLEVPESLLGDIYIAVGAVLERDRHVAEDHVAEDGAGQAAPTECTDGDQSAAEA
jgi:hypothetical protein